MLHVEALRLFSVTATSGPYGLFNCKFFLSLYKCVDVHEEEGSEEESGSGDEEEGDECDNEDDEEHEDEEDEDEVR